MATSYPGAIVTYTRDEVIENYLRDYTFRQPLAAVGPGTQPAIDAAVMADQVAIIHANAIIIGDNTNLGTTTGEALDEVLEANGLERLGASGASGYVTITTSVGGASIVSGMELRTKVTAKRYRALATAIFPSGSQVPIIGIDTGPTTNQEPGTLLEWVSPSPGLATDCVVFEQSDGTGLTNGRDIQSDADAQAMLTAHRANPPASGNEAEYIAKTEATPGLAIQKAFAYPATPAGPGNMSLAFLLRPETPGTSRLPNGAQRILVAANLGAVMPGDDGIFDLEVVGEPLPVQLVISWRESTDGWLDTTPWPPYIPSDPVVVVTSPAPTALVVRVATGTTTITPQVGMTICFYDPDLRQFAPKRIASFVENTPGEDWTLTFDTTNVASNTTFTPSLGQAASPYSTNLDDIPTAVVGHIDTMGPGEVVASFPDPGQRQRRIPRSPEAWPSAFTNRVMTSILAVPTVADGAVVSPTLPHPVPVGVPGTLVYLFELSDLSVYPQ